VRVFQRTVETRTPSELSFRLGRANRASGTEFADEVTGFEDRTPSIGFKDVAGLDSVVQDLRDVVEYTADPDRYAALGARAPTGILLLGDPGCGKTLVARALAGEVRVPFYFVSATSFVERFVGLGASRIRELFETASRDSPCIVFIDELDAVGRQRSDGAGDREFDHTLNQLLVELDGFLSAPGVITIGATNRPELLDSALVRPGRFDRRIEIVRPDRAGRDAILRSHAAARPCAPGVDWAKVAEASEGCSSAELAALLNESALLAARKTHRVIDWSDVKTALDRLLEGKLRSRTAPCADLDRRAAHEAGHALVAIRLPFATPSVRTSIMSCGGGASAVSGWSSSQRRDVSTGPQLLAELVVLMGGRAAEDLIVGSASTLSERDLAVAASLAERIETAELWDPAGPTSTRDLMAWARQEADRLVASERVALAAIAGALRANTSMFIDEIRALLPALTPLTVDTAVVHPTADYA
jgi:cell division protease FtsH